MRQEIRDPETRMPVLNVTALSATIEYARGTAKIRARMKLAILVRDGFQCVKCERTTSLTIDRHSPKYVPHDNLEHYKLEDCQTLCAKCHIKEEQKRGRKTWN